MAPDRRATLLERTAYHEAGHAVIAIVHRIAIRRVTIVRRGDVLGAVHRPLKLSFCHQIQAGGLPDRLVEAHVSLRLAGGEAERRFCGRYNRVGSRQDRASALEVMEQHVGSREEMVAWMRLVEIRTRRLVETNWSEIVAVATTLLEKKMLSAREVRALIDDCHRVPDALLKSFGLVVVVDENGEPLPEGAER